MSENTNIEWCDHTFNPWTGCAKVSPGCANCYAEALSKRNTHTFGQWGKGRPRKRTSLANWKLPLKWNKAAGAEAIAADHILADEKAGEANREWAENWHRPRVFCASLADWLDDDVPVEWLLDLLATMHCTPHLDWLMLTKRPQNFRDRLDAVMDFLLGPCSLGIAFLGTYISNMRDGWRGITYSAPGVGRENYWIGASVEDQARADERIPRLLAIPASVRFLSCEPLLGPVNIHLDWEIGAYEPGNPSPIRNRRASVIHWVIAGGESGPGARPPNPQWFRDLRDQCRFADVPFLFKQWGEWISVSEQAGPGVIHEFPDGRCVRRNGKKQTGRLLDGREWDEFPEVKP